MRNTLKNILQQQEEEERIKKIQRQEKAAQKFSKQRFMKNAPQLQEEKQPEIDPAKVAQHQFIKKNLKVDLIDSLKKLGVDFQDKQKCISWLNLSFYDYRSNQTSLFQNKENNNEIAARCLLKFNGLHAYIRGHIISYQEQKQKYRFRYVNEKDQIKAVLVPRLYLCLDLQDPKYYCQRVSKAFFTRIYADNLIKLKHYVDNMPTEGLSKLEEETKTKIRKLIQNMRKYNQVEEEALFDEAQEQYYKTMNLIIARKHLKYSRHELIPTNLIVSLEKISPKIPYYGLIDIKRQKQLVIQQGLRTIKKSPTFLENFKTYCQNTIYSQKSVIISLKEIQIECEKIMQMELFKTTKEKRQSLRFQQYQTQNNSYIQRSVNKLRTLWVNNIKQIIQGNFKKNQVPWFNFSIDPTIYHQSKMRKYFKVVKYLMQTALRNMGEVSFNKFYNYILEFIPQKVQISSIHEVKNYFSDGRIIQTTKKNINQESEDCIPLFETDLMRALDDSSFNYATGISNFTNIIMNIFNRMIEEINKVPEVEQKLMLQIYKKEKSERHLSAPNKKGVKSNEIDINIWLIQLYNKLKEQLQNAILPLDKYLEQFNELVPILQMKPQQIIKQMDQEDEENPKQITYLKQEIENYYAKEKEFLSKMPEYIHISFFKIYLKDIVDHLALKYHQTARGLEALIAKKAKKATKILQDKFNDIRQFIRVKPKDIQKLVQIKQYMSAIPIQLEKLKKQIDQSNKIYQILEEFKYMLAPQDLKKRYLVMITPKSILDQVDKKKKQLQFKKVQLEEQLTGQQQQFKNNLQSLARSISQFHTYNKKDQHHEIAQKVVLINEALANSIQEAKKFNSRQNLFQKEITDYSKVNELAKQFLPYSNLWLTTDNWIKNIQSWMYGDWNSINADQCEKFVQDAVKNLNHSIRYFKDRQIVHILKIAEGMKSQVDQFRPKVPLLSALRKNGLRQRHWIHISDKIGFKIFPQEDFSFSKALSLGMMKHIDICVEVSQQAMKQFAIQKNLNEMLKAWENINFEFSQFKSGIIIKSFDDVVALVDEHIANTQSMLFSPFKKPFEQKIFDWFNNLKKISDIMEEWMKLQMNWMYLQPIFDSPDIAKQLHKQSKNFKTTDIFWRTLMNKSKQLVNVQAICQAEQILQKIKDHNNSLDIIQKSLNNYLQSKRAKFARFYFLSNNQLLQILSQAKEPLAVQPYLKKVFENINQVQFDLQGKKTIKAMLSAQSERIPFDKTIDPKGKNVQDWMTQVEQQMKCSLRSVLLFSIKDYSVKKRQNWIIEHPGQCVLNGSQVHWTSQVQKSLTEKQIDKYYQYLTAQLNISVQLVRQKLSKNQSITLNALIVIDVHARDVVENLLKNQIDDKNAFEWISQLRYYWQDDNCFTKCVQTVFPYGYQYLGNTLRLVITPLTDKCYMTLMGALKLNLGGAPAGPAGTGKTETTKDLAKALAKQCVVFNCSDSMDFIMIGKFFKGLASAGAWACFDQFNRINIEVLSVIAQQLLVLFGQKAKGSTQVQFQGSQIKLQPTFSVFITMNPGYAGRTQLPDNLKALFRPVAMMVPDYAMIGQIMLYSFGFKRGRQLAKKMVVTFRLASEQLSSQDHYDYGMRAVRSVINAAGILKEKDPDMDQDKLLLRALRDVNVPKFLKDDLPLFENIIQDLFPGVQRPQINYGQLLHSINQCCSLPEYNFQPVEVFLAKTIQLYDTIQVRHGLMLVGPTGGGKTSSYRVLKSALTKLQHQGYYKVNTHVLNPKSINMGQLYGMFNQASRQWIDGVLAYTVRKCCSDRTSQKHWVMFDGPVDALWIQNMNTVLDDNKKLCLNSGQILTLTPHMTMMFEVEDLAVASPATVSRCGMVYIQPAALGVSPLFYQWKRTIPQKLKQSKKIQKNLDDFATQIVYPMIDFVKKHCKQIVATVDQNLLQSFLKIINCYFVNYIDNQVVKITVQDITQLQQILLNLQIFAITWSVGATTDYQGRQRFNEQLKILLSKKGLPLLTSYYDYLYNVKTKQFQSWTTQFSDFEVNSNLGYHQIIVPTCDSQRSTYMTKLLLSNNYHVMTPGPTGTGKSINAYNLLASGMSQVYQYISIVFSAQTSANQTQDTIDLKLEKIKRGVFGAPVGKKYIIFVDDLNMPKKEEYGAQPPIQILRQFLDHNGWYNRKDQQFMRIQNIILLTALGPPGGGRTHITPRMIRHFNMIAYTQLDNKTITSIFDTMVTFFFKRFNDDIKQIQKTLIQSVIVIYDQIKINLLPTPKKSHYTFNLRDISKVFQGLCNASLKFCNNKLTIVKLWYHEIFRVFGDRLINSQDRDYLQQQLTNNVKKFGYSSMEEIKQGRDIIFCDFWNGKDQEPRHYQEVMDQTKFIQKIYQYQEEYNNDPKFSGARGKNAMKLVLFKDACEHISKIVRTIRQPMGNTLLLGVGGSGRQSLAKMAIFISNHILTYIELIKNYNLKSWREDIKQILIQTGLGNKQTSFLFTDTQIVNQQMVQDLNSILNSGDVTGIYNEKDLQDIMNTCKGDCLKKGLQPNKMNIFSQYLSRVKQNIHIIFAMSPISRDFSTRLRMFPSLVNCCTLDWFSEWPEEALIAVGSGQLKQFFQQNQLTSKQSSIIEIFKTIHKSVQQKSVTYLNELRRHNYVTPMSYLELLKMFKIVHKQKQEELKFSINRLQTGLDKLIGANKQVSQMQIQLKDLQPQLEKSAIQTQKLMKQIQVQKKQAQQTQKIVSKQEYQAKIQTQQALQIAKQVDLKVQDANSKLSQSLKAVDKLKTEHLVEIKSHKNPPKVAVIVLGGCVIFFQDMIQAKGHEIVMKKIEGTIKKQQDWFNTARLQLLDNPKNFLQQLKGYDKQHINQALIAKFNQKIMKDPDYTYEKAKQVGGPIQALYLWQMAMYSFNKIYLDTQPLREKQAEVKQLVAQKTAMLNEKKKILNNVIQKINHLEKTFNDCIAKKEQLSKKIEECQIKLDRAKKLTSGLSDEKERWTKQVERLMSLTKYLIGNSILSAGMISYGGAFIATYRQSLHQMWLKKMKELHLQIQDNTNLVNFLGKPILIQQWTMAGLPKDQNSIQNGLIIQKSRRWPLMIDPQGQANKFIKNMGKQYHVQGIDVAKEKEDSKLMKILELAIQNGKWFLLENVGRQLDQSLEPILQQQIVKSSGSLSITFGDKTLNYNNNFKMFLTTTLPNPHYSPQTFVKVTVINFAITPQGLQDQMLAELVALENPQLEQKKKDIVRRNAADKKELQNIQDSILQSLSQGSGGVAQLLLDQTLINQLQNSKKFAFEINQRIQDSKITQEQIDKTREGYRSVAFRASLLFFCIIDLSGIDPMYQYSLQWFINLFKMSIQNALPAKQLQSRLLNLINYFTYSLYENVCRSLFEKHKLLFSFMLAAKIQSGKNQLDPAQWRYLLAGPGGDIKIKVNPTDWISQSSWTDIFRQFYGTQELPQFSGLYQHFMQKSDQFKKIFDSKKPQDQQLPEPWNNKLNQFQKLIVLKSIRTDKVLPGIQNWISVKLGRQFIVPPNFDLSKCFKDSTSLTPLIFMLSPGSDPVTDFLKFAAENQKKTQSISLGQGQGPKAQELVRSGQLKGTWILLQNCHLAASWMNELQKLVQDFGDNTHKQFRLWLTSMPTSSFPISVLQNGVKMTLQPPQGLRANLLRSYTSINDKEFNECQKPVQYKKLLFGFCFFHAIIQDRRKFGPIGWNIAYEFTNQDLNVSKKQLKMLLDEYNVIPYKVLNYLGAQINYGGRVTDDKDVRLIKTILTKYITPDIFKIDYKFSKSGLYYSPNLTELSDYINYIQQLPLNPSPQAFGMHENAEITTAQNQTLSLLQSILSIQPRSSSTSGKPRQQVIFQIAQTLEKKTPKEFPIQQIMIKFPTDYNESMNTVLVQELVRYNRLLNVMKSSLHNLKKALKGLVVMSEDLQKLANSIYDNQVGKLWADKGFLSLKPLGSWIEDLIQRIQFLNQWIEKGTPNIFWMSGFFFPQAFVTGSLQNYARKKAIAIDKISYKFSFLDNVNYHKQIKQKPQFGCYVYGLFLQGCRWNYYDHVLSQSIPKELFSQLPIMHLIPSQDKKQTENIYNCPLYKVVSRSGTLSTTGHSTNFVMYIQLPSKQPEEQWIRSGVATFLSLRY